MAEEKKPEKEKKPAGNKLMLLVVLLLILLLAAVGGLGGYVYMNMHKTPAEQQAEAAPKPKKKKEGAPVFDKIGDAFVVNLAGNSGSLLQVDMQVELADEEAKTKFTAFLPKIRSAVILLLSSKTPEELASPDGKVKLKAQVKQIINESMDAGEEEPVSSVLFTSFIIQNQ